MMRTVDFRVEILRAGVPIGTLGWSEASPPSISCSSSGEIAMTLRGAFRRNPDMDCLTDELRPVLIIDGVETPAGVYRVGSRLETHAASGVIYDQLECYDRACLLRWAKLEQRDFWPSGTSYETVISHYLIAAGITRVSFTPTAHTLQSDREDWDVGTPFLTIINDLLAEINYQTLWFDIRGTAMLRPYAAPSPASIAHTYGVHDGAHLVAPEYQTELDLFARPNVIICILENPEYPEPLTATAVNDSPSSALSTIRRGIRIPQVVKVDNIADSTELQAYANRLRDEAMQTAERITLRSGIQAGHNVADTVALIGLEREGIFRETGWTITLKAGTYMTHSLEKAVMI